MAKTRTSRKIPDPPTPEIIKQALQQLALDVPYYAVRLVGNRLEFHLYGGQVVTWPGGK